MFGPGGISCKTCLTRNYEVLKHNLLGSFSRTFNTLLHTFNCCVSEPESQIEDKMIKPIPVPSCTPSYAALCSLFIVSWIRWGKWAPCPLLHVISLGIEVKTCHVQSYCWCLCSVCSPGETCPQVSDEITRPETYIYTWIYLTLSQRQETDEGTVMRSQGRSCQSV